MMTKQITKDTPIATLTVGELKEVLGLVQEQQQRKEPDQNKKYVYGLAGIRKLFNVSHVTAQRYKDTFLADAVYQRGRKIMVDVDKAIELYKNSWYPDD